MSYNIKLTGVFGIGSGELFIIILVAVILLGPKELVKASRFLGGLLGRINATAIKLQREINYAMTLEENVNDESNTFSPLDISRRKIDDRLSRLSEDSNKE
ncbi:MAG: twin-arginine translocase TatA/TatE family subunit [Deltaproteobacteria bacterium]|nr:twin-arginine translocase TatA/TatE family subunit [Deltaproteobacteria bacterium]